MKLFKSRPRVPPIRVRVRVRVRVRMKLFKSRPRVPLLIESNVPVR